MMRGFVMFARFLAGGACAVGLLASVCVTPAAAHPYDQYIRGRSFFGALFGPSIARTLVGYPGNYKPGTIVVSTAQRCRVQYPVTSEQTQGYREARPYSAAAVRNRNYTNYREPWSGYASCFRATAMDSTCRLSGFRINRAFPGEVCSSTWPVTMNRSKSSNEISMRWRQ